MSKHPTAPLKAVVAELSDDELQTLIEFAARARDRAASSEGAKPRPHLADYWAEQLELLMRNALASSSPAVPRRR